MSPFLNTPKSFNTVLGFIAVKGVTFIVGFLNFLKKGKQESKEELESLEIPPPPSPGHEIVEDDSEISSLPNFSDEKEQEIPLPPLEPLEALDSRYLADMQLPDENFSSKEPKKHFDFTLAKTPPAPSEPAFPQPKPIFPKPSPFEQNPDLIFNPFKEDIIKQGIQAPIFAEKKPLLEEKHEARRERFIRIENFGYLVEDVEYIRTSAAINKAVANVRKIKASSEKEFEKLHRSLEDMQRSLVLFDQEIFEER